MKNLQLLSFNGKPLQGPFEKALTLCVCVCVCVCHSGRNGDEKSHFKGKVDKLPGGRDI